MVVGRGKAKKKKGHLNLECPRKYTWMSQYVPDKSLSQFIEKPRCSDLRELPGFLKRNLLFKINLYEVLLPEGRIQDDSSFIGERGDVRQEVKGKRPNYILKPKI